MYFAFCRWSSRFSLRRFLNSFFISFSSQITTLFQLIANLFINKSSRPVLSYPVPSRKMLSRPVVSRPVYIPYPAVVSSRAKKSYPVPSRPEKIKIIPSRPVPQKCYPVPIYPVIFLFIPFRPVLQTVPLDNSDFYQPFVKL